MPQSLFILEALLVVLAVSVPIWAIFWGGTAERVSAIIFASATAISKLVPLFVGNLATILLLASLAIGVWTSRQRKIGEA